MLQHLKQQIEKNKNSKRGSKKKRKKRVGRNIIFWFSISCIWLSFNFYFHLTITGLALVLHYKVKVQFSLLVIGYACHSYF